MDAATLATVTKLLQVADDADKKAAEREREGNLSQARYWDGFSDGLRRAITTVKGLDHSPGV